MVNFAKLLNDQKVSKKTNPIEIYESLDLKSDVGSLRESQEMVLNKWFSERRDKKNTIIKLHTGEGKTLVGLLILFSKLNSSNGPCMYVCPNNFLLEQTCHEAERFGIPYCKIEGDDLPLEFVNGEKILITQAYKVFNGYSKFGIDNKSINVGSIVLDDSHACMEIIQKSFTISVDNQHPLYAEMLKLFEDDLREQGEGTFLDIEAGEYDAMRPIPYWAWAEKEHNVTKLISSFKNDEEIKFQWPLVKDLLRKCQAFVSGKKIEIVPYMLPTFKYKFWDRARCRILMSANTQDDAFLIRDYDIDIDAIKNPLFNEKKKWSGEKMVLIPSLIDESLDHDLIATRIAATKRDAYGIVAIVPSMYKTKQYQSQGAIITDTKNIDDYINDLKKGVFGKTIVLVNRYDGIDLPDSSCRILLIDSKPYSNSLSEQYEESVRIDSNIINKKIAQRIEQGMGRSVRGEKDYSIIILIGSDLVQFIRDKKNENLFSEQTQKQIEIGIQLAKEVNADGSTEEKDYYKELGLLGLAILKREESWKEYYKTQMDMISLRERDFSLLELFNQEKEAEKKYFIDDFANASEIAQRLADHFNDSLEEKAWYMQKLARMKYGLSHDDSNMIQKSAYQMNRYLLKPKTGIDYKKIGLIEINRISKIQNWINKHADAEELRNDVEKILSDASFEVDSELFEEAIKNIGVMLGFDCQRPDKEYKKGPDVLWAISRNQYVFFECKNEVNDSRTEITKRECGQMNNHIAWFKNNYGDDTPVQRIWIHPSKELNYSCDLVSDVTVMRKGNLNKFKEHIKEFYKEFFKHPTQIEDVPAETIHRYLTVHKLDIPKFDALQTDIPYQKKK